MKKKFFALITMSLLPCLVNAEPACEWEPQHFNSECGSGLAPVGQFGTPDLVNVVLHLNGNDTGNCDSVVICSDLNSLTTLGYNEVTPLSTAESASVIRNSYSVDTEAFLLSGRERLRVSSVSYKDLATHELYQVHLELINVRGSVYLSLWDSWNLSEKRVALQQGQFLRIGTRAQANRTQQYLYVITGASSGLVGGKVVMRGGSIPAAELAGATPDQPLYISVNQTQQQFLRYGYLSAPSSTTEEKNTGSSGGGIRLVPVSALHDFKIERVAQPNL